MESVGTPAPIADDSSHAMARARQGSLSALGALLTGYRDYLLAVANRELSPQLRAKVSPSDLVQETFIQAQVHFAGFRGESEAELRAWLRRLLLSKLIVVRRHFCRTQARRIDAEFPLNDSALGPVLAAGLACDDPTPSKRALLDEQLRAVTEVLSILPPDYQEVLRLRYWERLPLTAIAQRMGRSPDAVQKLWFRAVERFRQEFVGDGSE